MKIKLENISESFVKELCKEPNIKEAFVRDGIIEETKQTAVEFLISKLQWTYSQIDSFNQYVIEAKEMEKQQIIEAYNKAVPFKFGEDYYNETFKK